MDGEVYVIFICTQYVWMEELMDNRNDRRVDGQMDGWKRGKKSAEEEMYLGNDGYFVVQFQKG